MRADVEFRLVHDGRNWVVDNGALMAKGETWDALDEDLRRVLIASGCYPRGARLKVFMGFDFDTYPTRWRQYHDHYFNRYVTVQL